MIDLLTDAHGWKLVTTERAPGRQSQDDANGAYYMHAATRTAVSATASQHELAPRVYELAPGGLAVLSGEVQLGDSILAVDGCTGDVALLTKRLAEAPFVDPAREATGTREAAGRFAVSTLSAALAGRPQSSRWTL